MANPMLEQGVHEFLIDVRQMVAEWPANNALPEVWSDILKKISDLKARPSYYRFREEFRGQNVLADFDYRCKVADTMHRASNLSWIAIRDRIEQTLGLVVIMEWGDQTPADPVIHRSYVDRIHEAEFRSLFDKHKSR